MSLSLHYGRFHHSLFANIKKRPQLPHFSTDLDETGIKIHGLLWSYISNIVIIKVAVPFNGSILPGRIYRRSYKSTHVILNLINKLGKIDKAWGLPSILSLLCNEFSKLNNAGARMFDSIYHMASNLLDVKTSRLSHFYHVKIGRNNVTLLMKKWIIEY